MRWKPHLHTHTLLNEGLWEMISFPVCRPPRAPPQPPAASPSLLCKHSVPEECWTPWPPLQFTRFSLAALCSGIGSGSPPTLPPHTFPLPPPEPLPSVFFFFFPPAMPRSFSCASPALYLPPPLFLPHFSFGCPCPSLLPRPPLFSPRSLLSPYFLPLPCSLFAL